MPDWMTIIVDAVVLLPLLILLVRLSGLRSFAKLSAHDFAVTVATGSVVAGTVLNPGTPWWIGALALVALFAVQAAIGEARTRIPGFQRLTDNEPLVLLRDGVPVDDALLRARVTRDDLRQKLRSAGVADLSDANLVVMETTGDVSVLTDAPKDALMSQVRRVGG